MKTKKNIVIAFILIVFLSGFGLTFLVGSKSKPVYTNECQRLKKAIVSGELGTIKTIFGTYRDNSTPNVHDESGTPLLFYAPTLDVAEYVVEKFNADLTLLNAKGETLLHHNIKRIIRFNETERVPVLKYFLRLGLDPDQTNIEGTTPRQVMQQRTCKDREFPWDTETRLLVNDPENDLLAPHDYQFDHRFANPKVGIRPLDAAGFVTGYRPGYEFYADGREMVDERLRLTFKGAILNPTVSTTMQSSAYDYESCKKESGNWACQNRSTGQYDAIKGPAVGLVCNAAYVRLDPAATYPSAAYGKNLQPDGRIILSYRADLPAQLTVHGDYDQKVAFESIKLHYGNWVGKSR